VQVLYHPTTDGDDADLSSLSTKQTNKHTPVILAMVSSDIAPTPLIAVVVSDVARAFLSLVAALGVHEDFKTQVSPPAAHDEFTRFKVRLNLQEIWK
jgi:hypothetical protein